MTGIDRIVECHYPFESFSPPPLAPHRDPDTATLLWEEGVRCSCSDPNRAGEAEQDLTQPELSSVREQAQRRSTVQSDPRVHRGCGCSPARSLTPQEHKAGGQRSLSQGLLAFSRLYPHSPLAHGSPSSPTLHAQKDLELGQETRASIELTFLGPGHNTSGSYKPSTPAPP